MSNFPSSHSSSTPAPVAGPKGVLLIAALAGVFGFAGGIISTNENVRQWLNDELQINFTAASPSETAKDTVSISVVEEESALIESVEKVKPSVVSIVISKEVQNYFNLTGPIDPFDLFFGTPSPDAIPDQPQKQQVGGGSGFIISEDGLILTNRHVVDDETAEYTVILNDGSTLPAKVLSRDPFNDLAVIKVEQKDLPVLPLGDSEALKLGQTVVAIGNALAQYENTVTKGVVSGIGREITAGGASGSSTLTNLIQTDAAINPGNSGGPLINLRGEVVGVNVAVDRSGEAIGFAIPIDEAKSAIESVKQTGKIERPLLGVRYVPITPELAKINNLSVDYGVIIGRSSNGELGVIPGSAADKAGLEENDMILEVNDMKINQENPLSKLIQKFKPGETVTLKIQHDGEEKSVEATLQKAEE